MAAKVGSQLLSGAPGLGELSSPLPPDRKLRLSAEVLATYLQVRWWMRREELEEVVARLGKGRRSTPSSPDDGASLDADATYLSGLRLGRAVSRTLRLLPADSRCLVRSLVLTGLLARRGVASTLVIGVRPGPEFAAHAWVEQAGRPLLDSGDGGFERLSEIRVEPTTSGGASPRQHRRRGSASRARSGRSGR